MNYKEICKKYNVEYLSDANLRGANLRYAYLNDANLRDADLRGANLSDANLSGAYLSGANLNGADLSYAYLNDANLRDADLNEAYLSGADLSGANLNGANLNGADLSGANLNGANLNGVTGNNKEIITIQTGSHWTINYTKTHMQIGCQNHTIDEWMNFSDDTIHGMDSRALEFWTKWKPILKLILSK